MAAGLCVGAVFACELGADPTPAALPVRDAGLEVGENVACPRDGRRLRTVRVFLDVAGTMATG